MNKLPFFLTFILICIPFIPACEVENCPPNALSYAQISLVDQYGRAVQISDSVTVIGQIQTDVTIHETLPDGNQLERIVYDSLVNDTFINKEYNVSTLTLPLSYDTQTRFIIVYNRRTADTISISHRNIPYFTNLDCGTMMFYEIEHATATRYMLDSMVVTNPNIDNNEKENIKIYFTLTDN